MSQGLYQTYRVTQEQTALSDGALMADARLGRALMAELMSGQQKVICGWCNTFLYMQPCLPSQSHEVSHGICEPCKAKYFSKPGKCAMPIDFAQGLEDVAAGSRYCADGIDWEAVENERIGD